MDKQKHNEKKCQKMVLLIIDGNAYYELSGKRGSTADTNTTTKKPNDILRADSRNRIPARNGSALLYCTNVVSEGKPRRFPELACLPIYPKDRTLTNQSVNDILEISNLVVSQWFIDPH